MATTAQQGEQVLLLNTWTDPELQALAAVRSAAARMLAGLGSGVGCDPTQNMPGATTCRRFGLALYAQDIEGFQAGWNANYKTFAPRLYAEWVQLGQNDVIDEVLGAGLTADGKYGPKTATAMVLVNEWTAGDPPKCACEMRAWVNSAAGASGLQWMQVPAVNAIEPAAQPATPPPAAPSQPAQPSQPVQPPQQVQMQQQPVAANLGRQTNTTVYWGVGVLAVLAAGGTWYYLKGRKGRRG
jgi:hypothetical protein